MKNFSKGMKLQWLTYSIAVLEISGFGPGWVVRMLMKTVYRFR